MVTKTQTDGGIVLEQLEGQWEKIFVALMVKLSKDKPVLITMKDLLETYSYMQDHKLLTWGHADSLEFRLVTPEQAEKIAAYVENLSGHKES